MIWVGQRKATTKRKNNQPLVLENDARSIHRKMKESLHNNLQNWKHVSYIFRGFFCLPVFGRGEVGEGDVFKLAVLHSGYGVSVRAPGSLYAFFVAKGVGKL